MHEVHIEIEEINTIRFIWPTSWMTPITRYLTIDELPSDKVEEKRIWKLTTKYTMVSKKLYKITRVSPILRCLWEKEITLVLIEVHEETCGNHISWQSLAYKFLRVGYYWLTLMKDNTDKLSKNVTSSRDITIYITLELRLFTMSYFHWHFTSRTWAS